MMKYLCSVLALVSVLLISRSSCGAVLVSLSSTPSGNPVVLNAGETLTIDVLLQGLGPAETLDYLGVTTMFDAVSLGAPTAMSFGPIVPEPASGILVDGPGTAIGLYDTIFTVFGTPISTEGTFVTLQFTAQNLAVTTDSTISIFDASYSPTGSFGSILFADIGDPLNVRVVANAVIPEPSSMIVFGLGSIALFRARKRIGRMAKG